MANIIIDKPENCWAKNRLKNFDSCRSCYYDQVSKENIFVGHPKCWDAGCIVYGRKK